MSETANGTTTGATPAGSPAGSTYRLPRISPRAYEHPADRAATAALRDVPMLEAAIRKLTEYRYERAVRQLYLANSIQIGPRQLPEIWNSYLSVLDILDMPERYPLYISQTPEANAVTIGADKPIIVVNSGLVSLLDEAQLRCVLAHEVGHILSGHVANRTALIILLQLGSRLSALPLYAGVPLLAIRLALLEWYRTAELSADRAATLVVRDPLVFCRSMMHLAGGSASLRLNLDAFIQQAMEYEAWEDRLDKGMRFFLELGRTHPFAVRRVSEVMKWVQSGEFDRITGGQYTRRDDGTDARQDMGEGVRFYSDRFQTIINEAGGSVQDFGRSVRDWLKRKGEDKDPDDEDPAPREPKALPE